MTITIKGQVIRLRPVPPWRVTTPWAARAVVLNDRDFLRHSPTVYAASWPEAMQAAQLARADLDRELMDEIHAERTDRRKPTPDIHTMEPTA